MPEMATLKLETIGSTRPWVSEIVGKDAQYGYARRFLIGRHDFSRANSKRARGVFTTYDLEPGRLYEVTSPESWSTTKRYFAVVNAAGDAEQVPMEYVDARLAARDAPGGGD